MLLGAPVTVRFIQIEDGPCPQQIVMVCVLNNLVCVLKYPMSSNIPNIHSAIWVGCFENRPIKPPKGPEKSV